MTELLIHSFIHLSAADLLMLTYIAEIPEISKCVVKLTYLDCQVLQPKSSQRGHLMGGAILTKCVSSCFYITHLFLISSHLLGVLLNDYVY